MGVSSVPLCPDVKFDGGSPVACWGLSCPMWYRHERGGACPSMARLGHTTQPPERAFEPRPPAPEVPGEGESES